jgi:Asp-tRNA(Asn)/Glu-tRNA(Gln) amidotransferase A subunit family amidase
VAAGAQPWDLDRHPGGSSSGSGVAVATGLAPGALGTDTGGSVRNPATCCGVIGMKPTYGSRTGVFPLSFSLDHVGPLTRTVEDNASCSAPSPATIPPTGRARRARSGIACPICIWG